MHRTIVLALGVAVLCGLAIGVQSTLNSMSGKAVGPVLTGLMVNFIAGSAAFIVLTTLYVRQGELTFSAVRLPALAVIAVAGLLGVAIITGIAYALPKTGIAAGLAAIIAGQMTIGVLVDTLGLAGGEPIPLSLARVGGVGLLALGTWAILPSG
jgi:bacterial/archaeal transporter family-2 protein